LVPAEKPPDHIGRLLGLTLARCISIRKSFLHRDAQCLPRGCRGDLGVVCSNASSPDEVFDFGCRTSRALVLPDPNYLPAGRRQQSIGISVSGPVRNQFLPPPFAVGPGRRPVLIAAVPETAINEYRHAGRAEHNVSAPAKSRERGTIHPETQPGAVESASQHHLWRRVAPPLSLHPAQRVGR
jgi:hypothetical protein